MTLGHAVNHHFGIGDNAEVIGKQRKVAIISEMIHTASLVHDDVLGKPKSFLPSSLFFISSANF